MRTAWTGAVRNIFIPWHCNFSWCPRCWLKTLPSILPLPPSSLSFFFIFCMYHWQIGTGSQFCGHSVYVLSLIISTIPTNRTWLSSWSLMTVNLYCKFFWLPPFLQGNKFTTDVNATAVVSDVELLPFPLLPSHSNLNKPGSWLQVLQANPSLFIWRN